MVNIGVLVVMTEASMGEVRLTPMVKTPWLNTTPSKEAKNNFSKSWCGTCSFGVKKERSQNSAAAPSTRISTNNAGVTMLAAKMNFATGEISPHMTLAVNMVAWPFISCVPMIDLDCF